MPEAVLVGLAIFAPIAAFGGWLYCFHRGHLMYRRDWEKIRDQHS